MSDKLQKMGGQFSSRSEEVILLRLCSLCMWAFYIASATNMFPYPRNPAPLPWPLEVIGTFAVAPILVAPWVILIKRTFQAVYLHFAKAKAGLAP